MTGIRGWAPRVTWALAATTLCALLPATAHAGRSTPCDARRGTTLAASAQVRVYRVGSSRQFRAYGCHYRTRRVTLLGGQVASEPPHAPSAFDFVLSGRFVAVDGVECEPAGCTGGIAVTDLRTGRAKHSASVEGGTGGNAQRMVLKANGAVAWTRPFNGSLEVVKLDADGEAVLDRGEAVDVQSLALGESTVYWMNAGVSRAAVLR
jgi:hypothetical protein